MYHHVEILRVLRDRTTTAVVRACDSNTVLKVDFGNIDSQSLETGDILLICVQTYNPPFLCANIQHKLAKSDSKEAILEESIPVEEQYLILEAQEAARKTPRKRMCFY